MAELGAKLFAGIDAGGTSFKCGLADAQGNLIAVGSVPTTTPTQTIDACVNYLTQASSAHNGDITAIGLACFGPLDIDPQSSSYGSILKTPKLGWSDLPIKALLAEKLDVPVAIDTDVNGALAAEMCAGAAQDVNSAAYITVGTGIGASIYLRGDFLGAITHPEFGHIFVKRHKQDMQFEGKCDFHKDCLEGLASAAAFEARFGDPRTLPEDHIGWDIQAYYLAQACLALRLTAQVERIVIGGGLLQANHLIQKTQRAFSSLNNGYLPLKDDDIPNFIRSAGLGTQAGLKGALLLATQQFIF